MELQGTDGINTVTTSVVSIFSGIYYKPMTQWSQSDIDAWATQHQPSLQDAIDQHLTLLTTEAIK
jgi:hypothetical protein